MEISVLWRVFVEMRQLDKPYVYEGYGLLYSEYLLRHVEKPQQFDLLLILALYLKVRKTFWG